MFRIDRVKEFLNQYFSSVPDALKNGVDSNTVANALGIWRNDASADLNSLVECGLLTRKGNRPVLFFPNAALPEAAEPPASKSEVVPTAFSKVIGANGSLGMQIQLAKAASLYPPTGMHLLLIGATGVGKTLLAEEIWRFVSISKPDKKIPFAIFNCSEYSDNPQLLLSQLFGHDKGSFTGADSDKPGMLERVNGGVLFLDEIHRLPKTGQEMFFTVIDKGIYRRLGSTVDRKVQLMIIGATTEDPKSSLLDTFKRRIPVLIQVPSLAERPVVERFELVHLFLTQEAQRLHLPINVSAQALKMLIAFKSSTNIGDLRNEIQLTCARSYLSYLNRDPASPSEENYIQIGTYCLSRKINNSYTSQDDIEQFVAKLSEGEDLTILPEQPMDSAASLSGCRQNTNSIDFYGFIEKKLSEYSKDNKTLDEITTCVSLDLKKYYNSVLSGFDKENFGSDSHLYTAISDDVAAVTSELIRIAQIEFSRQYSHGIRISIASFLEQTKAFANAGRVLFNKEVQGIGTNYGIERKFLEEKLSIISEGLNVFLTEGELAVLALLLAQREYEDTSPRIDFLVIAHGNATASEITRFINQGIGKTLAKPIDVPINCSNEQLIEKLDLILAENPQSQGIILMTDITLASMVDRLLGRKRRNCMIVPCLSTPLALEICKHILTSQLSSKEIVSSVLNDFRIPVNKAFSMINSVLSETKQSTSATPEKKGRKIIITCCVTGMGSARIARELLLKQPGFSALADIIPLGIPDDIPGMASRMGARLKLVIGHFNPGVEGVPFISMDNLLTEEGLNRIRLLLQHWNDEAYIFEKEIPPSEMELTERMRHINKRIHCFAPSLPKQLVIENATMILNKIDACYVHPLSPDLSTRIYIHSVTMFERLISTEPIPMANANIETAKRHAKFFNFLKSTLREACAAFHITISDSEVYYLMMTLPNPETMQADW